MPSLKLTPGVILDLLGVDYIERPNRLAFCCPHHHDTDPSAGFYLDTELAHCFSCDYTLDVVGFYAKYKDLDRSRAERDLEKEFGTLPKRRFIDYMSLARARAKAERRLEKLRPKGLKIHAQYGELLDKVLLAYERGQIEKLKFDKALKIWYNKVDQEIRDGPDHKRFSQGVEP